MKNHEETILNEFEESGHSINQRPLVGKTKRKLGITPLSVLRALGNLVTLGFLNKKGCRYTRTGKELEE